MKILLSSLAILALCTVQSLAVLNAAPASSSYGDNKDKPPTAASNVGYHYNEPTQQNTAANNAQLAYHYEAPALHQQEQQQQSGYHYSAPAHLSSGESNQAPSASGYHYRAPDSQRQHPTLLGSNFYQFSAPLGPALAVNVDSGLPKAELAAQREEYYVHKQQQQLNEQEQYQQWQQQQPQTQQHQEHEQHQTDSSTQTAGYNYFAPGLQQVTALPQQLQSQQQQYQQTEQQHQKQQKHHQIEEQKNFPEQTDGYNYFATKPQQVATLTRQPQQQHQKQHNLHQQQQQQQQKQQQQQEQQQQQQHPELEQQQQQHPELEQQHKQQQTDFATQSAGYKYLAPSVQNVPTFQHQQQNQVPEHHQQQQLQHQHQQHHPQQQEQHDQVDTAEQAAAYNYFAPKPQQASTLHQQQSRFESHSPTFTPISSHLTNSNTAQLNTYHNVRGQNFLLQKLAQLNLLSGPKADVFNPSQGQTDNFINQEPHKFASNSPLTPTNSDFNRESSLGYVYAKPSNANNLQQAAYFGGIAAAAVTTTTNFNNKHQTVHNELPKHTAAQRPLLSDNGASLPAAYDDSRHLHPQAQAQLHNQQTQLSKSLENQSNGYNYEPQQAVNAQIQNYPYTESNKGYDGLLDKAQKELLQNLAGHKATNYNQERFSGQQQSFSLNSQHYAREQQQQPQQPFNSFTDQFANAALPAAGYVYEKMKSQSFELPTIVQQFPAPAVRRPHELYGVPAAE